MHIGGTVWYVGFLASLMASIDLLSVLLMGGGYDSHECRHEHWSGLGCEHGALKHLLCGIFSFKTYGDGVHRVVVLLELRNEGGKKILSISREQSIVVIVVSRH